VQQLLRRSRLRKPWAIALLVATIFTLLQIPRGPGYASPDMAQYLNQTYTLLGDSPGEARDKTIKVFCANWGRPHLFDVSATGPYDPAAARKSEANCVDRLHEQDDLAPGTKYGPAITKGDGIVSPRYEAIFLSRPAIAWFYAPAVALLPDRLAIGLTAIALVALAGVLVFLMLRALGVATGFAALGQALFYLLPIGTWSIDPRGEAPVVLLTVVAMLGAVYVITNRTRLGVTLMAGSFLLGVFVKYSQFMLLAAALAGTATLALLFARRAGRPIRPLLIVLGVAVVATVINFLSAKVFGWPSGTDSMQDLVTGHYVRPDVPDPVAQWLERNRYYWVWWIVEQLRAPLVLCSWLLGAWGLWRSRSSGAFIVVAAVGCGFLNQTGHPNPSQADRLIITVWMVVVCGLPLLLNHLVEQRRKPGTGPAVPAQRESTEKLETASA
jgi:hypothetical protein